MARIAFQRLAHAYAPGQPHALKPMDMVWDDAGAYALLGPSRLRQDDAAKHRLRPAAAERRFGAVRRPGCHHAADGTPQRGAGIPVSRRLRHHDGAREPGLPAAQSRHVGQGGGAAGGARGIAARPDRATRPPRPQPRRRREAEDLARTRPGARRCRRHPVRRAADRHRPASEVGIAVAAEGAAPAGAGDDDLRDARPDGGADLRRPRRGDGRGRGRAGRHAGSVVR
jgi:hypothetical protein